MRSSQRLSKKVFLNNKVCTFTLYTFTQVSIVQYPCKSRLSKSLSKRNGIYLKAPNRLGCKPLSQRHKVGHLTGANCLLPFFPPIHCSKWGLAAALLPSGLIGLCGIMELCAAVSIGIMMDRRPASPDKHLPCSPHCPAGPPVLLQALKGESDSASDIGQQHGRQGQVCKGYWIRSRICGSDGW